MTCFEKFYFYLFCRIVLFLFAYILEKIIRNLRNNSLNKYIKLLLFNILLFLAKQAAQWHDPQSLGQNFSMKFHSFIFHKFHFSLFFQIHTHFPCKLLIFSGYARGEKSE